MDELSDRDRQVATVALPLIMGGEGDNDGDRRRTCRAVLAGGTPRSVEAMGAFAHVVPSPRQRNSRAFSLQAQ